MNSIKNLLGCKEQLIIAYADYTKAYDWLLRTSQILNIMVYIGLNCGQIHIVSGKLNVNQQKYTMQIGEFYKSYVI